MSDSKNEIETNFHGNPISGGKTPAEKSERTPTRAVQVDAPVHELIKAWCEKRNLPLGKTATKWLDERLRAEVGKEMAGDDKKIRKYILDNAPRGNAA